jgi:hypothetical protein
MGPPLRILRISTLFSTDILFPFRKLIVCPEEKKIYKHYVIWIPLLDNP